MSRDYRLYLEDILESCRKILRYIQGLNFEQFVQDDKTYDAVIRNLEIIGEAAKSVPEQIRKHHPDIEWRKISGMRDVVAHAYFGVNDEIVWDVLENKIPVLQTQISEILNTGDN